MSAPRELVLGTAGHIDHGKTSLVRALTGTDTDRLPEEKRRGITIELGFAQWLLDPPAGLTGKAKKRAAPLHLGIVDVPGHEALVRTMVAGAGGMDAVLLVISAEDGVMPQTREHLHVCELLGLRHAVVALTKIDRLDGESEDDKEELLELAREDIREQLAATPFAEAPIVPVSAHSGEGLEELRATVWRVLQAIEGRPRKGLPVLPVDRVFTIKGHGTVVTGTLISGALELPEGERSHDSELLHIGQDLRARAPLRLRGMQVHGGPATRSRAGMRTALNLGGVAVEALQRGDVLTRGDKVLATDRLLARVHQLGFGQRAWARDTALQLCAGTASTAAHLVPLALEDPETGLLVDPPAGATKPAIPPGGAGLVRLYLDTPLPVWAGQRLILRAFSAAHMQEEGLTVGGGVVVDPLPERRHPAKRVALARALLADDLDARLLALVDDAGDAGIGLRDLAVRSGIEAAAPRLERLAKGKAGKAGPPLLALSPAHWVLRERLEAHVRAAVGMVDAFHAKSPLLPGMTRATVEGRLPCPPPLSSAVVDAALERGMLRVADRAGSLARPGKGALDPDDLPAPLQAIVDLYRAAGTRPPTLKEVGAQLGHDSRKVLELAGLLQRNDILVRVSDDLSYDASAHAELLGQIRAHLREAGELDVQALKAMTGLSRKFAVPFMEHLDRLGVTRREGDRRVPGPAADP
ncbi:Translation elongation factor, selenocysteine-specific [Plesiocystis pacifica SIR-1]|uniref:Translation elongation factor, selenocysteine-specific n=1 Tax=Plesiocystis pacifica SIR-1 TaxID=391625 RepID=A6G2B2_9BACT|nr:selenocysteine-specific translation elongation factor [Plesiocystis pacifica]EDM80081.1 Translation elongation factor, selenocysteine-specific [Plesiocystis pacifica SIR-1]